MNDRVLLIFTVWPYPTDSGKKVILKSILEFIVSKYGDKYVDIILIDEEKISINPFKHLNIIQIAPTILSKVKNILSPFSRKSFQEKILYDKDIEKLIISMLKNNTYKLVIFDTLRTGQYIDSIPDYIRNKSKFVLYMDDLFHIRYGKLLDSIDKYSLDVKDLNLFGNFEKFLRNLPMFKFIRDMSSFQLMLLKKEKNLIKKRELEIVHKFDINLLISYEEVQYLKEKTKMKNIYTLPPLLDNSILNRRDVKKLNKNLFLFLGNLSVPHNRLSLQYFLENCIISCIESIPDFKLIIIGKNISDTLRNLIQKYEDNILYKGYVKDISFYINSSIGMLVPLIFGSGVKLKTLEALSWGLPIVSTHFGIEGVKMEEKLKKEILEEDFYSFCKKINNLTNIDYNIYVSKLEKENYEKFYSKEVLLKKYEDIFD